LPTDSAIVDHAVEEAVQHYWLEKVLIFWALNDLGDGSLQLKQKAIFKTPSMKAMADQLAAGSSSRSSLHNPLPSTSKCTWEPSTEELNSNDVQAPSTSTASITHNLQQNSSLALEDVKGNLTFTNCTNFIINFYIHELYMLNLLFC
jgi:hypothetical protein